MRFASWRWTPVWAVPVVGTWLGLLILAPVRPKHLDPVAYIAYALGIGAVAALPFLGFALISLAARPRPHVLRAAVIGGLAAAALIWVPWNGFLAADALGAFSESSRYGATYLAIYAVMASPLIVIVGMFIGGFAGRRSHPAG